MKLWMKILIALVLGVIAGLILGPNAIYLKPIGTLFLNSINMIIILLVFSSMTVGITSIHDPKKLGRVGGKTVGIYLTTTILSIIIGISFANLFLVGKELDLVPPSTHQNTSIGLYEILISIVPSNPIAALVEGNILQIIVFAIFLGLAINFSGEKGLTLFNFFESILDVMYSLTSIIMEFSPIGVFGIMAWVAGTFGLTLLVPLFKFLGVYYLACLFHVFAIYGTLLKVIGKLELRVFFRGIRDALKITSRILWWVPCFRGTWVGQEAAD